MGTTGRRRGAVLDSHSTRTRCATSWRKTGSRSSSWASTRRWPSSRISARSSSSSATRPSEEAQAFQENMKKHGLARAVIHANYLINLASPKKNGLRYSRAAFVEELDRAQVLGIRDVIFHPGAHLGKGEAYALKTIAASLDWSLDHSEAPDVFAVLEITAGQGSVVGYTFAQLAEIMKACSH